MRSVPTIRGLALVALASLSAVIVGAGPATAHPKEHRSAGSVYALSNDPAGNAVLVFHRAPNGSLTPAGSVATGGLGTGAGLGSQGALTLGRGGRALVAVNPGSDQISAFRITNGGPVLTDVESSGGDLPISVSIHGRLVYALNDGSDSLSGFRLGWNGDLKPIHGSTIGLSGSGIAPAQVQFSPNGRSVVVTEKNTNLIDVYRVRDGGRLRAPNVQASQGETPFGFAFDPRGRLLVSEAFGGAPDASTVSSYRVGSGGQLGVISSSVPDHQSAACWVTVARHGRFAYTTNTGSDSVSGYRVARDGRLTLMNGPASAAGDAPTDLDAAAGYLYVLNSGSQDISAYVVDAHGSLVANGGATGLPAGSVGIAAA